jgi:hypothetical protein
MRHLLSGLIRLRCQYPDNEPTRESRQCANKDNKFSLWRTWRSNLKVVETARNMTKSIAINAKSGGTMASEACWRVRRAENVQNVPLSIVAVSGQTLAAQGITDVLALQRGYPSAPDASQSTDGR